MWVSFEVEERPDLNALMENFFSTLKTSLVYRHSWRTRDEAENALFAWVRTQGSQHPATAAADYAASVADDH